MVFCKQVFADRSGEAASRFLAAAAACVIILLLSFAAANRKCGWIGCTKVLMVMFQQIFLRRGIKGG
jgi:hypothetical protein